MNTTARIVLLNGAGSAGKTSIARALQAITASPFLHVQMDTFMDMLPETHHAHPDGFTYETADEAGRRVTIVKTGPVGETVLRGMRHAVAAMAGQGNNLIVDDVLLGDEKREYADLLSPFVFHRVGLFAPLEILEAREHRRRDRSIGLARWQYGLVHKDMAYDLEVDTGGASPMECAALIKEKFGL
ncbi:chloramphenicol 3-O phosphotransferase [Mesorhizobium albiziae]|uniref:Chloramphenicol 3-O phosphotransferase n=1 Tax=Neomesorhizobium albiziae TaxID=335020 RepID=A0A1I4A8G5_9HYPH|nr:chloramphenicol phosphotransferase [Mesorhizobium albiziae]GLS34092.1 putative O-phosphotransferase [Mesorhizobium albiziae]SFK52377.1 chloramphenicol 3-O phosphotransferase [Mesorhizobium albiziae]